MTPRRLTIRCRWLLHRSRLLQIGALCTFWCAGEAVARLTGIPIPGAIVGMALVLALLAAGRLSLFSMQRGAEFFLADMLLFFIPPVLGAARHTEFFGLLGLKLLAVVVLGTVAVMAVTGLAVDLSHRWMLRHGSPHPAVR